MRMASFAFDDADVEELPLDAASKLDDEQRRRFGDLWAASKRSLVLRVPSMVVPPEFNCVVNPAHDEFPRLRSAVSAWHPLPIDKRLLKTPDR